MNKVVLYACFFLVLCYALYSVVRISTTFAPDFSVYYGATKGLLSAKNVYALPLYTGLGYPPFTLLPFIPLTRFPYHIAQSLWIGTSFMAFLLCIYLSMSRPTFVQFCRIFVFAFMAFPTKFTLGMGQINFIALALFLLAIRYQSGYMYGLLLLIKPHFALLFPLFDTKRLLRSALVVSIGILVIIGCFGVQQFTWYGQSLPQLTRFAGRDIYYNQGIEAFFSRLFPGSIAFWVSMITSAILVVAASIFSVRMNLTQRMRAMVAIPVFLLIEPLSWQHHYIFLLPVYVWLWQYIQGRPSRIIFWVSYVLVAINFRSPPTFLQSHVCIGNSLLLGIVVYEIYRHHISY